MTLTLCAALSGCAMTDLSLTLGKIPTLTAEETTPARASPAPGDSSAPKFREFELEESLVPTPVLIQRNDTLKVSLWGYPELDHVGVVQSNGMITLPLVGEVLVDGLSVDQIRARISERLQPFTSVQERALRVGDTLTMSVWQQPDLSYESEIAPDGTATFPLAGQVQAVGRSVADIRQDVQSRIDEYLFGSQVSILPRLGNRRMLYDPVVSVLTQSLQPRRVAIIGAVGLQGVQEINGSLTLVEALARASVDRRIAALNSVVVIRDVAGKSPLYRRVQLADFFAGKAPNQNIYLRNGDVVIVPKTAISEVGDYVDLFFQRTAPLFAWWTALQTATVAEESAETVELINESLRRQLIDLNVNP
ncbi:MAG: polysaccharide biosynthesis/export family protein [Gammaproteobacteria bacterium]